MTGRPLSRRAFVSSVAAATLGPHGRAGEEKRPRKYRYIDIHTHLGTFYWGQPLTLDGMLRLMDHHGIEKACILPLVLSTVPQSQPPAEFSQYQFSLNHRLLGGENRSPPSSPSPFAWQ